MNLPETSMSTQQILSWVSLWRWCVVRDRLQCSDHNERLAAKMDRVFRLHEGVLT